MSSTGAAGSAMNDDESEERPEDEEGGRRSKRTKKESDLTKKRNAKKNVYYPRDAKFPPVGERENWTRPDKPPIVVFFNAKGGTLKTTHTWTIAYILSKLRGLKVLAVDMDSQRDLTRSMLKPTFLGQETGDVAQAAWLNQHLSRPFTDEEVATYADHTIPVGNVFHGASGLARTLKDALQSMLLGDMPFLKRAVPEQITPGLFLLPGSPVVEDIDRRMTIAEGLLHDANQRNWQGAPLQVIMQAAKAVEADIVLLDLNPSLSTINRNMIMSSDYVAVTTRPEDFSLENMDTFMNKMVDNDPVADTYGGSWLQQMIHRIRPEVNMTRGTIPPRYPLPATVPKVLGCIIADYSSQGNVENTTIPELPPGTLSTQVHGIFHDNAAGAIQSGMARVTNRMRDLMTNRISNVHVMSPSVPNPRPPEDVSLTIGSGMYQAGGVTSLLAKIRSYESLGPLTQRFGIPAPFIEREHCINIETGDPLSPAPMKSMLDRAADFKRRYDQLAWNILKLMDSDPGGKLEGKLGWALLDRREVAGGPPRPNDGCPNAPTDVQPGY